MNGSSDGSGKFEKGNLPPRSSKAGRKKGTPNRSTIKTRAIQASLITNGDVPLQFLVELMRNPKVAPERRDRAAIACLPFMHAKMSPRPPVDARAPGEVAAEIRQALAAMRSVTAGEQPPGSSSESSPDSSPPPTIN